MSQEPDTFVASVIGAGGYSGAEIVGLLLRHPGVKIGGLFGSSQRATSAVESDFASAFPSFRGLIDLPIRAASVDAILSDSPHMVFLATPHEASHDLAPQLCSAGVTVFDLSAAFRLTDEGAYPKHYSFRHHHSALLKHAVYGLAELNRREIEQAQLVAVPGCYPTSVILPVRPLVDAGLLTPKPIIVDSTSGVSGAGRSPALRSLFCEVSQQPYGVFTHRHQPEMEQECKTEVTFTPHLGPYPRGILSTVHATLTEGVSESDVRSVLRARYAAEPFIQLLPAKAWPSVGAVVGTNRCDIGFAVDEARRHLILCSAIDNLLKGSAGQAVQCMNIRFGFDERTGFSLPSAHFQLAAE
jgi:N-acetyl-gamma-glutamyl-phosphate reductase